MKNTYSVIRPTITILLFGLIAFLQTNNLQSSQGKLKTFMNQLKILIIVQASSIKNRILYKSDDVDDLLQGVITNKA